MTLWEDSKTSDLYLSVQAKNHDKNSYYVRIVCNDKIYKSFVVDLYGKLSDEDREYTVKLFIDDLILFLDENKIEKE